MYVAITHLIAFKSCHVCVLYVLYKNLNVCNVHVIIQWLIVNRACTCAGCGVRRIQLQKCLNSVTVSH
jgi:hypothetical protein